MLMHLVRCLVSFGWLDGPNLKRSDEKAFDGTRCCFLFAVFATSVDGLPHHGVQCKRRYRLEEVPKMSVSVYTGVLYSLDVNLSLLSKTPAPCNA